MIDSLQLQQGLIDQSLDGACLHSKLFFSPSPRASHCTQLLGNA